MTAVLAPTRPAAPLNDLLANRRWWQCDAPFPHYVATSVFTPDVYRSLVADFRAKLHRSGYLAQHDLHGTTFEPGLTGPLSLFVSRPWHDLVAGLFGVRATGHVSGGTHHHDVGSKDGLPHNDLNPGWFIDYDSADGIVLPQHSLCSYTSGVTTSASSPPRRVIRAVAVLYYLDNPPWRPGDGGETALYLSVTDPVDAPAARIAPRNNTLLAFECTPYSYHGFLANRVSPRNSVVMWLHREPADVEARWGTGVIEEFQS
jgi:hypothetical protein